MRALFLMLIVGLLAIALNPDAPQKWRFQTEQMR